MNQIFDHHVIMFFKLLKDDFINNFKVYKEI